MFDKKKFANIIEKIKNEYENQEKFSDASGINRTYLSQYMNMRIQEAPTPSTLYKLASASKGITTYDELLIICGYNEHRKLEMNVINSLINRKKDAIFAVPLFTLEKGELVNTGSDIWIDFEPAQNCSYFGYKTIDESMAPLLNTNDIAIILKKAEMEITSGKTYLINYNNTIIIRKILETSNGVELQAMNPYYPIIKTTIEDIKIIGRVIKAENQSAF